LLDKSEIQRVAVVIETAMGEEANTKIDDIS